MGTHIPWVALRTFVLAARLRGFRAAAEALHVTPGAVSQRIAALETHLGVLLFERTAQGARLTPAGDKLFGEVVEALSTIESALAREQPPARLRIHTISSFANLWLIPRLNEFNKRHTEIHIEIQTSTTLAKLTTRPDSPDLAIRYGSRRYPRLRSIELMKPELVLVCHPDFAPKLDRRSLRAALRTQPLLRERNLSEWRSWLDGLGLEEESVEWGPILEDDAGLISAALAGQGIATVRRHYVDDHISKDALRCLAIRKAPHGYHFVARPERIGTRSALSFQHWLLEECRRSSGGVVQAGY